MDSQSWKRISDDEMKEMESVPDARLKKFRTVMLRKAQEAQGAGFIKNFLAQLLRFRAYALNQKSRNGSSKSAPLSGSSTTTNSAFSAISLVLLTSSA